MEIKPSYCQPAVSESPDDFPENEFISRLKTTVCRFPDLKAFRQMEERHYKTIYLALQQRGDVFKKTDELKLIGVGILDISIPIARLPVMLGAGKQADFRVLGKGISGIHCQLGYQDNMIRLEDMESKNGTFVNGRKGFMH